MTADITTDTTVTLTLDIDALLQRAQLLGYGYDDEPNYGAPLVERIAQLAAEKIAKDILDDTLKEAIGDAVCTRVNAAVEAAMAEPVQRTTPYGSAVGEAKPLRDVIAAEAQETVKQWMHGGDRYGTKPTMKGFLEKVVDRAVAEDLNGELAKARAAVTARVQAEAARLVAETAMKAGRL
jgi:hypothetical protein